MFSKQGLVCRCGAVYDLTITAKECASEPVESAPSTDVQQPQLEMPRESDFMAWCDIQHYNQAEAASIYRYIARHIKRVR